jgi:DNA-binding CsgD family transcriptional regulator
VDGQAPKLRGRAAEIDALERALEAAASGAGRVVLIEGEAGIGKTRLLGEFASRADACGFEVAAAAAEELELGRPFGVLVDALGLRPGADDEARARIGRLVAEAPPVDWSLGAEPGARFLAQEAIIELVEQLATRRPLLLAVDDLHWADRATLATLGAVGRRAEWLPVLVVAAYRPSGRVAELDRLVGGLLDRGAGHLVLGPLGDDVVVDLAGEVAGGAPGPGLLGQLEGARGNPFFVIELVRSLAAEDALVAGDVIAARDPVLPAPLGQSILRRLGSLPDETRDALRLAAVLGTSFRLDDLAHVLDRSVVETHRPIYAAVKAGLLDDAGDHLAFRHDLIRDALYADLPEAIRISLHREVGTALAGHAPAIVVAHHLALGAVADDPEATEWLRRAADEAARHDPATAVELLDRALALAGDDPLRIQLLEQRVVALMWAGRLVDAETAARAALAATPSGDGAARLRAALGETLILEGKVREAAEELDAPELGPELPARVRAVVRGLAATAWLWSFDLERARDAADEAVRVGERAGAVGAVTMALGVSCRAAAYDAEFARAIEIGERAVAVAGDDVEALRRVPHLYLGLALVNADRSSAGRAVLVEGQRRCEQIGAATALPLYQAALTVWGFSSGAWDDALAEAAASRLLIDDVGTRFGQVHVQSMVGLIACYRGDDSQARAALSTAREELETGGATAAAFAFWPSWLEALLAERAGDTAVAARLAGEAFDLAALLRVHSVKLWCAPDALRLARAIGDDDRADAIAADVEQVAHRAQTPTADGTALLCRGMLERDPDTLLRAVEQFRSAGRALGLIGACEQAGAVLADSSRREEAVAVLREGLAACEELEAAGESRRLAAQLRELGVRFGATGRRDRPATGWGSLTPAERSVVQLIGEGLSNREIADRLFISRRTVEGHVSRLYQKLQTSNRVALAQEASGHLEIAER